MNDPLTLNVPASIPTPETTRTAGSIADPRTVTTSVLSADQIASARLTWANAGHDPAVFDAAMKADGYVLPEPLSEEEIQNDLDHGYTRDIGSSEYSPNWFEHSLANNLDGPAIAQLDAESRNFAAAVQMPVSLGTSFVEIAADNAARYQKLDPSAKELFNREQAQMVERRVGPEKLAEMRKDVEHLVAAAKANGATSYIERVLQFAAHDGFIFTTLANEGARLRSWHAGMK